MYIVELFLGSTLFVVFSTLFKIVLTLEQNLH